MRHAILMALSSLYAFSAPAVAQEGKEGTASSSEERIVTPVEGVTKFTVPGRSTKFRIAVTTISGGTIDAPKIIGKAKLVRSAEIVRINEDGQPQIGAIEQEFVFQGTAAGEVKIEFRKTIPTEPMPIVESYTVTIK